MAAIQLLNMNGNYMFWYDCNADPIEEENFIKVNCIALPLEGEWTCVYVVANVKSGLE